MPTPTARRKYSVELMLVPEALTPLPGAKAILYFGLIKVKLDNFKDLAAAASSQAHSRYKEVSIACDLGTLKEALHPEVNPDEGRTEWNKNKLKFKQTDTTSPWPPGDQQWPEA